MGRVCVGVQGERDRERERKREKEREREKNCVATVSLRQDGERVTAYQTPKL